MLLGASDEAYDVGGVLDLDGSFIVVEWVEGGNVGSGDSAGGVGRELPVSNSSE